MRAGYVDVMEGEKSDVLLRLFRKGDEEEIIPLFNLAFDEWRDRGEGASDFWTWLYQDNPLKRNLIIVGVSNGRIVSCNSSIMLNIKIHDRTLSCTYGAFSVVHPDFRRRGIATRTRGFKHEQMKMRGIKFNYSYTVNPIARYTGLKYHSPFPQTVLRYLRIRDVGLHTRTKKTEKPLFSRLGYEILLVVQNIRKVLGGPIKTKGEIRVLEIRCFDDRAEVFWKDISEHHRFIVERSCEYLNWRYCDPRVGEYRVLQAEDDEGVLGYIVLAVSEKTPGYSEGYILDLLFLSDRLDVSNKLVEEALKRFDSDKVNAVHCLAVKGHPSENVLKRNGFVNRREEVWIHYFGYGIEEEMKLVGEGPPGAIHFFHGDLYSV